MLNDRLWPAPVVVLRHRGRRSGKLYRTPVEAITEDRERAEIVISPMRGTEGDWYRNLKAGGLVEVSLRGEAFDAEWRELSEEERREAATRYLAEHPRYAAFILRSLMRLHELEGDPVAAVSASLPMLSMRLTPART
jgi:deazaflavin-dependent oxidoreductase (nitroreductase family)